MAQTLKGALEGLITGSADIAKMTEEERRKKAAEVLDVLHLMDSFVSETAPAPIPYILMEIPPEPPSPPKVFMDKRPYAEQVDANVMLTLLNTAAYELMPFMQLGDFSRTGIQTPSSKAAQDIASSVFTAGHEFGQKPLLKRFYQFHYQPNIPDPGTLATLRARVLVGDEFYYYYMKEHGYQPLYADMMAESQLRYPDFSTLLTLLQRGHITYETWYWLMRRTQISSDAIEPLSQLRWQLPGYQDIISVYMREGYMPEKWVEIPDEFVAYMEKLGYNNFWALRLWGKHWVLPGIELLYDMLAKEIIDKPTLIQMLRYHDFEPVWRERLLANAYAMVPRVDIRRGYRYGLFKLEDLARRYRWLRYRPEEAEVMAQIAERYSLDKYYTQIETQARRLFKEGYMSEEEFRGWLRKCNLPEKAISLAVDAEKLAYRYDYTKDLADVYVEAYRKDVLTLEEAYYQLTLLDMQPERVSAILAEEMYKKMPKPKVKA